MRSIYKNVYYEDITSSKDCAKIRGSCVIMGLVGLVPSRHRAFVGISWVQNFCSWVFRGAKIFARGYFVGPKNFLLGISWVPVFFRGYFVGPRFFLVGISWVLNFLSWVTSLFSVADHMRESGIEIYLKLRNLLQIDFDNCEFCLY